MQKKKNGFTLTELLATIVIVAILIGIAVPIYFNISKGAKENEYNSKKNYLQSLGKRYAEENNISLTTKISVSRLVASGYTTAEKYVIEEDTEIPFISNPIDSDDNLACRVIELEVDNYEYSATIEETSDCSFAVSDLFDSNIGLRAYTFENNKIGELITYEDSENATLNWTNKDVLIVVDPNYQESDIKQIVLSTSGNTKIVDQSYMLKESDIDYSQTYNLDDYSNVMLISATAILKQDVSAIIELESTIKNTSMTVRIDKEAPTVDTKSFSGWTSSSSGASLYLSDGNGSGVKGVYVSDTDNFQTKGNLIPADKDGIVHIKDIKGNKLESKRYYIWTEDNVKNISMTANYIDISNVDDDKPVLLDSKISSAVSGYNSIKINVEISATDGNGSGIYQGCITTTNNPKTCTWFAYTPKYTYTIPNASEGSGEAKTFYVFVRDAVLNVSDVSKEHKYTLYRKCSETKTVDGPNCSVKCDGGTYNLVGYDKYLDGVRCTSADRPSGGKPCNVMKCCSKLNYGAWSACSAVCGTGTQTRTTSSAYNGQSCGTETVTCKKPDCCSSTRTEWGACQGVCDSGVQEGVVRSNYNNQLCGYDSRACALVGCCTSTRLYSQTACSAKCNGGTTTNTYVSNYNGQYCSTTYPACNTMDCCSKTVKSAGKWGKCSKTCGGGTKKRTVTYYSAYDERVCKTQKQKTKCNTKECPPSGSTTSPSRGCCWSWDGGCHITQGECSPSQDFLGCDEGCSDDCGRC